VPINAENLRHWVVSSDTAAYANAYAWCVMPLDFIYLAVLGGFLALGAHALASTITWPPPLTKLPLRVWLIFPIAYAVADFIEDCLILLLMTHPSTISNFTVDLLTFLRSTKIGTNAIAIIQIFALGLAGVVWK
jgi:hypothetical protein